MNDLVLSIVVIGRNEERSLPRLYDSLRPLISELLCETIYVDSASTDSSVNVANPLFDLTVVLSNDSNLSASAGRFTGVNQASGDWFLFLDGDMTLEPGIVPVIVEHVRSNSPYGLTGNYVNVYKNGGESMTIFFSNSAGMADHFGGAVLLPGKAVRAENWDPRLFAYEEIELYTRLRQRGYHVRCFRGPFVRHYTERLPKATSLKGNFIRQGSVFGKRFFGVGQMLAARFGDGTHWSLIRWLPDPFVLWGGLIISLVLLAWDVRMLAALIAVSSIGFVVVHKSPKYVVIYLAFLPQALHGVFHFARDWRPAIASISKRGRW